MHNSLSITKTLREELNALLNVDKDNAGMWYSKIIQLEVRKRILVCLKSEFSNKVRMQVLTLFQL